MKMSYISIMTFSIFITICASYIGYSTTNKISYTTNDEDNDINNSINATGVTLNRDIVIITTPENNAIKSTENNRIYINNLESPDVKYRNSNLLRNSYDYKVNDNFVNESKQIENISNHNSSVEFGGFNIPNNNEKNIRNDSITTVTKIIVTEDLSGKESHTMVDNTKSDGLEDPKDVILEKRKVILQHHLQLVPMEDKPFDSMMLKSQRYMISVLVPVGVGMVGASMIVCTVVTLRKVVYKRIVHTPLNDDVEADGSMTSHISSVSLDDTDKVVLLHTDGI